MQIIRMTLSSKIKVIVDATFQNFAYVVAIVAGNKNGYHLTLKT